MIVSTFVRFAGWVGERKDERLPATRVVAQTNYKFPESVIRAPERNYMISFLPQYVQEQVIVFLAIQVE